MQDRYNKCGRRSVKVVTDGNDEMRGDLWVVNLEKQS